MTKIRLFCNAGMSTSMLVNKMREAATAKNIEVDIVAYPINAIDSKLEECDVILLGPQVAYEEKRVRTKVEGKNIPVGVIAMVDYGMMKGDKVLDYALSLI